METSIRRLAKRRRAMAGFACREPRRLMRRLIQWFWPQRERTPGPPNAVKNDLERHVLRRHTGPLAATMYFGLGELPESVAVRDINEHGLYLWTAQAVPVGSTVKIDIDLPPEMASQGRQRVRYLATVVRLEPDPALGRIGVALTLKSCTAIAAPRRERGVSAGYPDKSCNSRGGASFTG